MLFLLVNNLPSLRCEFVDALRCERGSGASSLPLGKSKFAPAPAFLFLKRAPEWMTSHFDGGAIKIWRLLRFVSASGNIITFKMKCTFGVELINS
jgi:hypothetical protein